MLTAKMNGDKIILTDKKNEIATVTMPTSSNRTASST